MKKILIITGSRADYGKLKGIIKELNTKEFNIYIFVTGMHLLKKYGNTYINVVDDAIGEIFLDKKISDNISMEEKLSITIKHISNYVKKIKPNMILIHGDRLEALAGAIVGSFENIYVSHIEGGELSGTIDEKLRHSISKLSNFHFVSNYEAKERLIRMGEQEKSIFVVGSPDIDIMLNEILPTIDKVKGKYNIKYNKYAICIFHPVTTEQNQIKRDVNSLISALIESKLNYIIIYPNNDMGKNYIIEKYNEFKDYNKFKIIKSFVFEDFLTLLKNSEFMIGNSSAGIRECGAYGIPCINLGTRQNNRINIEIQKNIQNCKLISKKNILLRISKYKKYRNKDFYFGDGSACKQIAFILSQNYIWKQGIQKIFNDK